MGYPTLEEEVQILDRFNQPSLQELSKQIQAVLSVNALLQYRQQVKQIHIEAPLLQYIATLVNKTRNNQSIYLGASPRASLALLNTAKAYAALQGRDFVKPEDVQTLAAPVLRHRIILSPEKEMEGGTADDIIAGLMRGLEVPR